MKASSGPLKLAFKACKCTPLTLSFSGLTTLGLLCILLLISRTSLETVDFLEGEEGEEGVGVLMLGLTKDTIEEVLFFGLTDFALST